MEMNLSPKTTRALEDLLLVAAVFAVLCVAITCIYAWTSIARFNRMMDHGDKSQVLIDKNQENWAKATTHILSRGAAAVDETAKLIQMEKDFWKTQNQDMAALIKSLNRTVDNANENVLPSVTMTVRSLDDSIQDFRGQTANLMADAHQNLVVLGDTQARLNESIVALDVETLGRNVNLMAAQGVTISRNTASATGHLDGILADAHKEADKFVAPKTGWQKFKGALGVFWRVAAFAIVKAI